MSAMPRRSTVLSERRRVVPLATAAAAVVVVCALHYAPASATLLVRHAPAVAGSTHRQAALRVAFARPSQPMGMHSAIAEQRRGYSADNGRDSNQGMVQAPTKTTPTWLLAALTLAVSMTFAFFWSRQRKGGKLAMAATTGADDAGKVVKTDEEWRAQLSPQQYQILRQKGTEYAKSGKYDKFYPSEGYFVCAGCGNPLYSAAAKFNSGCGWPAFDKCYKGGVKTEVDNSLFMRRVEIMCARCDGHLGHVFENEGFTPTNERHCVNSASIEFVPNGQPPSVEEPVMK